MENAFHQRENLCAFIFSLVLPDDILVINKHNESDVEWLLRLTWKWPSSFCLILWRCLYVGNSTRCHISSLKLSYWKAHVKAFWLTAPLSFSWHRTHCQPGEWAKLETYPKELQIAADHCSPANIWLQLHERPKWQLLIPDL